MVDDSWAVPERENEKPRTSGLTMLLDNGYPTGYFTDVIESHGDYVDLVKFGWGTALATRDIARKAEILRGNGVEFCLGGTLFEKCVLEDRLDDLLSLQRQLRAPCMEVSNGTIDLSNEDKGAYIRRFSGEFRVFSEVGYKDSTRSLELHPARWVEFIQDDLAAGAERVITESRESGTSGICRGDGELRFGLIGEIAALVDVSKLIFEAPTKPLQVYFLKKFGPSVNLANISFSDVVGLETLRHGLRSDTLQAFSPGTGATS